MRYKIFFWFLFLLSAVLFFAPISVAESTGLGLDKLVHFILFGVLVFFGKGGYQGFRKRASKIDPVFTFLALYAIVVEFIQGQFLPYRSFDWLDTVAGILGLIFVFIIVKIKKDRTRGGE